MTTIPQLSQTMQTLLTTTTEDLAALITIGDRWMEMVGTRQGVHCDQWRTDATGSAAKYIRQFALNLKKDEQAVRNACTMAWSNGQTEGHVNRLKALKRQMYDSVGELCAGCEYLRERRFVRLSQDTWCQIINNPNDIACRSGAEMLEMRFLQSNGTR